MRGQKVLVNGGNSFNEVGLHDVCKQIESGVHVDIYIDCIGHTRTVNETEKYRQALEEKYGQDVVIEQDGLEISC